MAEKQNNDILLMKMVALESNIVTVLIRLTAIETVLIKNELTTKEKYNELIKNIAEDVAKAMEEAGSVLDDIKQEKLEGKNG
ncbi:MAG TPA: hypothetical protein VMX17_11970 [Candidatus Glassbacteria bacterium]|nr:hypothetical protein [Candidatus Glassbacteria bacterium]